MTTDTTARRAEIEAQIANIEARIEKLGGRVARGDMGEPSTLAVRAGRHVIVGRNESFLNLNYSALAQRKQWLAELEA
jgi:hypothetical protein